MSTKRTHAEDCDLGDDCSCGAQLPTPGEEVLTTGMGPEPVLIVRRDDGDGPLLPSSVEVWLEPHARAHADGLCIGTGKDRRHALADAARTLQALATSALVALHD